MPTHAERKFLPFTPDQMFDLVAGVERYPEFLPWCLDARVRSRKDDVFFADLTIGFRMVRESYTSKVTLDRAQHRIDVVNKEGPFRRLSNHWVFEPAEGGCIIDFYVDFEFQSILLQKIMGSLFNEATKRMVAAFEKRAIVLYS